MSETEATETRNAATDFLYLFIKTSVGGTAHVLRVPTFVRRVANKETLYQRVGDGGGLSTSERRGLEFGAGVGIIGFLAASAYLMSSAVHGDYGVVSAAVVANFADFVYELDRRW